MSSHFQRNPQYFVPQVAPTSRFPPNFAHFSENPSHKTPKTAVFPATRPFFSPQGENVENFANIPRKSEDFDDIVAKCLSRTRNLIAGIKKVHNISQNSVSSRENTTNSHEIVENPLIYKENPHFLNENQHKPKENPHNLSENSQVSKEIPSSPLRVSRPLAIKSSFFLKTSEISRSPPKNASFSPSPKRLSSSFVFLSPVFIASELESYQGELLENNPHGTGVCLYKNGYKYQGTFENGLKHGFGILSAKNNQEIYVGEWEIGKFQGDGLFLNPVFLESSEEELSNFAEEIHYNELRNLTKNWIRYEGGFFEGKMHGFGTLLMRNQEKFRGNFVNGRIHGEGSYYRRNGEIICGFWENGDLINVF